LDLYFLCQINFDIAVPLNFGLIPRTLMGIIDDYFDGYYSEEMIESQVMLAIDLSFCISVPFPLAMLAMMP
jgi:hypothetical protein